MLGRYGLSKFVLQVMDKVGSIKGNKIGGISLQSSGLVSETTTPPNSPSLLEHWL